MYGAEGLIDRLPATMGLIPTGSRPESRLSFSIIRSPILANAWRAPNSICAQGHCGVGQWRASGVAAPQSADKARAPVATGEGAGRTQDRAERRSNPVVVYNTKRPQQGSGVNGRTTQTAVVQDMPKPPTKREDKIKPKKTAQTARCLNQFSHRQLLADYPLCTIHFIRRAHHSLRSSNMPIAQTSRQLQPAIVSNHQGHAVVDLYN